MSPEIQGPTILSRASPESRRRFAALGKTVYGRRGITRSRRSASDLGSTSSEPTPREHAPRPKPARGRLRQGDVGVEERPGWRVEAGARRCRPSRPGHVQYSQLGNPEARFHTCISHSRSWVTPAAARRCQDGGQQRSWEHPIAHFFTVPAGRWRRDATPGGAWWIPRVGGEALAGVGAGGGELAGGMRDPHFQDHPANVRRPRPGIPGPHNI